MNKLNIILAIKFDGCDKELSKFCIQKLRYPKTKCTKLLNKCHYPMMMNPLCTCDTVNKCNGDYQIKEYKKQLYIFYQCRRCSNAIKLTKDNRDKFIKKFDNHDIIYGKELDELVKKAFTTTKKSSGTDLADIIELFTNVMPSVGIR